MARRKYPSDHRPYFRVLESILDDDRLCALPMATQMLFVRILATLNRQGSKDGRGFLSYRSASALADKPRWSYSRVAYEQLHSCGLVALSQLEAGVSLTVAKWAEIQGFAPATLRRDSDETPALRGEENRGEEEPPSPLSPKPRRKRVKAAKTEPPEDLSEGDWRSLVARLWKSNPHLVAKDENPPAPHCSLGWVRSQTVACLDHWRGKGELRANWSASCSSWVLKSDADNWRWLKRAPPPKGEYHADAETFLPDCLRETDGPQSTLDLDERGDGRAASPTPAEHIARAGAKPALRLADPRA